MLSQDISFIAAVHSGESTVSIPMGLPHRDGSKYIGYENMIKEIKSG
jgi:hypothetical protein